MCRATGSAKKKARESSRASVFVSLGSYVRLSPTRRTRLPRAPLGQQQQQTGMTDAQEITGATIADFADLGAATAERPSRRLRTKVTRHKDTKECLVFVTSCLRDLRDEPSARESDQLAASLHADHRLLHESPVAFRRRRNGTAVGRGERPVGYELHARRLASVRPRPAAGEATADDQRVREHVRAGRRQGRQARGFDDPSRSLYAIRNSS